MQDPSHNRPDHDDVTLVAWQALPAVVPQAGRNVGGLELAAWKHAKVLAKQLDANVNLVVRSHGSGGEKIIDGVRVIMIPARSEAIRRSVSQCIDVSNGFRLKRFSWKLLWQVPFLALTWPWRTIDPPPMKPDHRLEPFDPDVWIAFGVSQESAGVIATAIEKRKPSLLMLQSNADLDPQFLSAPKQRNAYGELGEHCQFAIANATQIACQSQWQVDQLAQHFGRTGVLIPNSTDPDPWREAADRASNQSHDKNNGEHRDRHDLQCVGRYVLWIGRYDRFHKRPELAVEIARKIPQIPFRMIINASDEQVRRSIHQDLPANIQTVDYVEYDQMPQQFADARVFLSTGNADFEGFPAVLLHAIAAGKPIVSLDDFSNFIHDSGGGVVTDGSTSQAADAIRRYWNNETLYDRDATSAYLDAHHSVDVIGRLLAKEVRRLMTENERSVASVASVAKSKQ